MARRPLTLPSRPRPSFPSAQCACVPPTVGGAPCPLSPSLPGPRPHGLGAARTAPNTPHRAARVRYLPCVETPPPMPSGTHWLLDLPQTALAHNFATMRPLRPVLAHNFALIFPHPTLHQEPPSTPFAGAVRPSSPSASPSASPSVSNVRHPRQAPLCPCVVRARARRPRVVRRCRDHAEMSTGHVVYPFYHFLSLLRTPV